MASVRSVNLELGLGQTETIQLGAPTPVRGVKEIDEVLFPRFTGAYIEYPDLDQTLARGQTLTLQFPVTPSGKSFISEDVRVSQVDSLIFPYLGVYQIRIRVAYRTDPPDISSSFEFEFRFLNGNSNTTVTVPTNNLPGSNIVEFNQEVRCDGISRIQFANGGLIGGSKPVIVGALIPGSSPDTFVEVRALGVL